MRKKNKDMQIASARRLAQISYAKRCQEMAVYLTRPSYKAETKQVANMVNGFDAFLYFFSLKRPRNVLINWLTLFGVEPARQRQHNKVFFLCSLH